MSNKFRVAMIGAGSRANQVIYPALDSLDDVEIEAICDIDHKRLKETANKYDIDRRYGKSVTDYRRMIDEVQPDAIFAIGQPDTFYDIWKWCLEQGLNLYVEKPLAIKIHQARSLAYLAQKNNCITQVSFQRRFTPMVVHLRQECLKKGPIVHAVCKFYKNMIEPYVHSRDHMMDDCVHSIDTLRWMCGGEVIEVESHVKRIQVPDINFISATLYFDNGSTGYLINSWSSGKRIFSIEMHSPGIFVEAEHENKGYLYTNGDIEGVEYDTREVAGSDEFYDYTGVTTLCRHFVECCKIKKQPATNFSDAVKTMEIAERILAKAIMEDK